MPFATPLEGLTPSLPPPLRAHECQTRRPKIQPLQNWTLPSEGMTTHHLGTHTQVASWPRCPANHRDPQEGLRRSRRGCFTPGGRQPYTRGEAEDAERAPGRGRKRSRRCRDGPREGREGHMRSEAGGDRGADRREGCVESRSPSGCGGTGRRMVQQGCVGQGDLGTEKRKGRRTGEGQGCRGQRMQGLPGQGEGGSHETRRENGPGRAW